MKKLASKGFVVGILVGLAFVAYKLLKYSGGGGKEQLTLYIAAILACGVLGAILECTARAIAGLFKRR